MYVFITEAKFGDKPFFEMKYKEMEQDENRMRCFQYIFMHTLSFLIIICSLLTPNAAVETPPILQ